VTLNDVATAGITLDSLAADSTVALTAAGNTAIVNDTALSLQGTVTGTLAATATTGGISDSGTLSATGAVTLTDTATAGIDLGTLEADSNVALAAAGDTAITNDSALALEGTVTGTLDLTTGGAVTDSGALSVSGATTIGATGFDVTLDAAASDFETISVTGANVTLADADNVDLATTTASGTLNVTAGGAVTDVGDLSVAGVTMVTATGHDITLDSSGNSLTAVALVGDDVSVASTGSLTGSVTGTTLQANAETGVDLTTVVSKLAATTESGDLSVANVGGLEIEKFTDGLGLEGVSVTAGVADDGILLRAMSPITINAPISNTAGEVILAAEGGTEADAILVNAEVSSSGADAAVNLYAGGSIELSDTASISSLGEANLFFGTDYDGGEKQEGYTEASITISQKATIEGDVKVAAFGATGLGLAGGRVTSTTLDSAADYFNALDSLLEASGDWDVVGTDALLGSAGLGTIVLDFGDEAAVSVEGEENKE